MDPENSAVPFLDLRISDAAMDRIRALLDAVEPGSIPLLLNGVEGVERKLVVEIGHYPPAVAAEMAESWRSFGEELIHDCNGLHMAVFDSELAQQLEGHVLVHVDGAFALRRN